MSESNHESESGEREQNPEDTNYPYTTTWRRGKDKEECLFSDWTIALTSSDDQEKTETYHVHRIHIINSGYFKTLVTMSKSVREHDENTSRISLQDNMMDLFPFVLDYLYGVHNNVDLIDMFTAEEVVERFGAAPKCAVVILSLARYFAIEKLIESAEVMIISITSDKESEYPIDGLSKGESLCCMLSETIALSEDEMTKVLQKACAREYASSNSHERKVITRRIPLSTKAKVLELSIDYVEKNVDRLLADIKDSKNIKNGTKLIDDYRASRKSYLVEGAGVEGANGVYNYVGAVDGHGITYSKKGVWNGRNELFSIWYDDGRLYFSIIGKFDDEFDGTDTDFYKCDDQIWEVDDHGVEPVPRVTLV